MWGGGSDQHRSDIWNVKGNADMSAADVPEWIKNNQKPLDTVHFSKTQHSQTVPYREESFVLRTYKPLRTHNI